MAEGDAPPRSQERVKANKIQILFFFKTNKTLKISLTNK